MLVQNYNQTLSGAMGISSNAYTVAYLDVEQPFKGFHQVHQVGGLAVLIHDVFGEEQTAYHFHDVDKGCLVCEIERGKGLFVDTLL